MAEPIEMPFGLRTWVGQGNHVSDGVQISHGKGQLRGNEHPTVKYRDMLWSSVQKQQNRSKCRLAYGLEWAQGIMC